MKSMSPTEVSVDAAGAIALLVVLPVMALTHLMAVQELHAPLLSLVMQASPVMSAMIALPAKLEDAALCTAEQAAASLSVSMSTWHELVRTGEAPQPVVRRHRYTRWRVQDVCDYIEKVAARGTATEESAAVVERMQRVTAAAMVKRQRSAAVMAPASKEVA